MSAINNIRLGEKLASQGISIKKINALFSGAYVTTHLKKYGLLAFQDKIRRSGVSQISRSADAGIAGNNFIELYLKLDGFPDLPLKRVKPNILSSAYTVYKLYFPHCTLVDINVAYNYIEALCSGRINQSLCLNSCQNHFYTTESDYKKSCPSCRILSNIKKANDTPAESIDTKNSIQRVKG